MSSISPRPLVLVDAPPGKHLHVDHDTFDPVGDPQGRIFHVARLFAEDGPEQLLFRRELGLALRGYLAHEDVARLHGGADPDDTAVVEVLERLVADVRDVPGDFFLAELRIPDHALQLLDMDGGEDVFLHEPLVDEDRVLVVVSSPRHEGDHHVLSEGELAPVRGRSVGEDLALLHVVAFSHDDPLVDAGILVRPPELQQVVDVYLRNRLVVRPFFSSYLRMILLASTLFTTPVVLCRRC